MARRPAIRVIATVGTADWKIQQGILRDDLIVVNRAKRVASGLLPYRM